MEYNGQYKYTFNSLCHQKFTYLNWPEIFSSLLIGGRKGDCPKFLYLELTNYKLGSLSWRNVTRPCQGRAIT